MSPNVRRAVSADTAAVVDLVESAYRGETSRAGWTTEADLLDGRRTGPDEIGSIIADRDSVILLLDDPAGGGPAGAGVVGCCVLRRTTADTAEFGLFAVRPVEQGGGLGSILLAEAERVATESLGATRMEMAVITHRVDLIGFYERRGYAPTGEHRPFPAHDERFGRPRRDDLEFLVLAKPTNSPAGVSPGPGSS